MHNELLAQSPLLALPLVAMFLFISVWVLATVRAMKQSRAEMAAAARLPLDEEVGRVARPRPSAVGRAS